MNKTLGLVALLCLSGCAEVNKAPPIAAHEKVIISSGNAAGKPTETSVSQLADLLVEALNKSREERERKEKETQKEQNERNIKESNQTDHAVNQALKSFVNISKKQGAGEITLFFSKGSDSLEGSYSERDRLVQFLDYLARESHGRKIMLLSIGSASVVDTPSNRYEVYGVRGRKSLPKKSTSNKIQLSVARARAPLATIEKYLVNVPHQTYDAYGIGERKSTDKSLPIAEQEMFQHVRIIAAFEKSDLPLLPK